MKARYLFAPTAIVLALGFGVASAQTAPATPTGASPTTAPKTQPAASNAKQDKLARADRKFIENAAAAGMFEVQAGQIAETRATDPAVKSFAAKLVKDHTAANKELLQLASQKQVEIDEKLSRPMRRKLADLQKASGAEFDRMYVREVAIEEHEDDVETFQKASKNAKDPQVKAWIDKTLPVLQAHLASAKSLPQSPDAARLGASGAANGKPAAAAGSKPAGSAGSSPAAGTK